jgi:hypothetical protein
VFSLRLGTAYPQSLFDCQRRFRVYDETGNVIETHEHAGDFKEP